MGWARVVSVMSAILGPKRPSVIKSTVFEAGSEPSPGTARQRFAVKFYVVALLFIVFDVEAVFLYPWAVNFKALGWFGYVDDAGLRGHPGHRPRLRLEEGRAGVGELRDHGRR